MLSHFGRERFDEVVAWYMMNGYVYFGDDAIILAQKCNKSSMCSKNNEQKELDKDDAWYVQYAAGQINRFFELCPEPLEWVVFERWGKKDKKAFKYDRMESYFNGRT
jgi:hypothetical protein